MTTTIAVGVDGRPEHRAARDWAITRAIRDGSRLELVYVIQRGWGDVLDEPDDALALAARRLVESDAAAADRATTTRLKQALALVDVRLLDHIIVADGDYVSMASSGLLR